MNIQYIKAIASLLLALALFSCGDSEQKQAADTIYHNGNIYTVNEQQPQVEAVAVKDGKIIYAGDKAGAEALRGSATTDFDLKGRTMTPGLTEGHGHFIGMGYHKLNLDLSSAKSYADVVDMVAEAAKDAAPGEWILGRGWHQDKWDQMPENTVLGFQTHDDMSAVSPDNPVYLRHASGHAGFANAKAMEIAGVQPLSPEQPGQVDVQGGEVFRDKLGNPTGIFNERAMTLITKHIPEFTAEKNEQALLLANQEALRHGITSFHDAGIYQETIDQYIAAIDSGMLDVRIYAMLAGRDKELLQKWYERGPLLGYGDNHLTIRAIKMYMDGALGSRGAWLLEEYSDQPGHFGHLTQPMEDLREVADDALEHGFQVCSHAIGDRANREVLDNYQAAFAERPDKAKDHRFRVEHAQHLHPDDIPRFAEMNVIAAMQAIHMASDRPWAIDRLGQERIVNGAYVWQKLLQSGARIVNGSDVPVEPIDPMASFYASVTRKTLKGTPEEGYEADQAMTREQALRSYTLDAAYSAFEEDIKGSIEPGKLADFAIFERDIMTVSEAALLNVAVDYTIIGGEVVYERKP